MSTQIRQQNGSQSQLPIFRPPNGFADQKHEFNIQNCLHQGTR